MYPILQINKQCSSQVILCRCASWSGATLSAYGRYIYMNFYIFIVPLKIIYNWSKFNVLISFHPFLAFHIFCLHSSKLLLVSLCSLCIFTIKVFFTFYRIYFIVHCIVLHCVIHVWILSLVEEIKIYMYILVR